MFKIKVADLVVNYNSFHEEFFAKRLEKYLTDEEPMGDIGFEINENITIPPHTQLSVANRKNICKTDDGMLMLYSKNREGRVNFYLEQNHDYTHSLCKTIHFEPTENYKLTDCDREYMQGGFMFNNLLLKNKGTTLHGSAISYKGQGIIFSAPPGTGKSTHTEIWKKLFPNDVEYINDDKPCIRFHKGKPYVYGSPWSGKTDLNNNIKCPLKAIIFIGRSEENAIKKVGTAQSFSHLNDQTFPPFYDIELFKKNFDVLENIIKTTPIYWLDCNMDDESAMLVRKTIFKER